MVPGRMKGIMVGQGSEEIRGKVGYRGVGVFLGV